MTPLDDIRKKLILDRIDVDAESGCWVWRNKLSAKGYGRVKMPGTTRNLTAHRVAYEAWVGPIPDDRPFLDHLCRNRACVNPGHLEPVTNHENTMRGQGPSAIHAAKETCVRGHDFEPAPPWQPERKRWCRECHNIRLRSYRARKAATA